MHEKKLILEKIRQRKEVRIRLENFQEHGESEILIQELKKLPQWNKAKKILLYAPMLGEVNVWPLLKETSKKYYFPKIYEEMLEVYECNKIEDFEVGYGKILEPKKKCKQINPADLDLVVVPGLVFDLKGGRIGRGRGFYDMFLVQTKAYKVALAYKCQIVQEVPLLQHDQRVDKVLVS